MTHTTRSFRFIPTENSFLGALGGILKGYDSPYDLIDIGGHSGFVFLNTINPNWTDPATPTLHTGNVKETPTSIIDLWDDIIQQSSCLGFDFQLAWDPLQYEYWNSEVNEENEIRALELFNRTKQEIDNDRPVILFGVQFPDYGIVSGYEDTSYVFSGFLNNSEQPQSTAPYQRIQAKGGMTTIFHQEINQKVPKDQQSLEFAVRMAKGPDLSPKKLNVPPGDSPFHLRGYTTGPHAYDAFAALLAENDINKVFYGYVSFLIACWAERANIRQQFITRIVSKYSDKPQSKYLNELMVEYNQISDNIHQILELFPFTDFEDKQKIPSNIAQRAATLLNSCVKPEFNAIKLMESALFYWETDY